MQLIGLLWMGSSGCSIYRNYYKLSFNLYGFNSQPLAASRHSGGSRNL